MLQLFQNFHVSVTQILKAVSQLLQATFVNFKCCIIFKNMWYFSHCYQNHTFVDLEKFLDFLVFSKLRLGYKTYTSVFQIWLLLNVGNFEIAEVFFYPGLLRLIHPVLLRHACICSQNWWFPCLFFNIFFTITKLISAQLQKSRRTCVAALSLCTLIWILPYSSIFINRAMSRLFFSPVFWENVPKKFWDHHTRVRFRSLMMVTTTVSNCQKIYENNYSILS